MSEWLPFVIWFVVASLLMWSAFVAAAHDPTLDSPMAIIISLAWPATLPIILFMAVLYLWCTALAWAADKFTDAIRRRKEEV
jgi:hypothetical protein